MIMNSNHELTLKVNEVIEDLCNSYKSFTSLDVSNKVKQQGFATTRHRSIACIVRSLYAEGLMNNYNRSLIDVQVSGNTRQAYLYHHKSVPAEVYDKRLQVVIHPQIQLQISQMRKQKGDCRLEIPSFWIKQLGWSEGSTIYAVLEGDILLKPYSNDLLDEDNVLVTVTISDGRLRVPKTAFTKAGFQNAPGIHHEVTFRGGYISVKDS